MDKALSESCVRASVMPEDTTFKAIPEYLKHHAAIRPDKEAFVFLGDDGSREVVTWTQLYSKSVTAARGFIQLGVKRHDLVAVNVRNCPDWLYINFGIIFAGARVAHTSFTYKDGNDVVPMMKKLGTCSTIILDTGVDDNWNIFKTLVDEPALGGTVKSDAMPNLKYLVVLDRPRNTAGLKTFHDILSDAPTSVELPCLDANDVITLFETSGSTGDSKLVARTHTTLLAYCSAQNFIFETCAVTTDLHCRKESGKDAVDSSDLVTYNARPFFWLGGWPVNVQDGATRVTQSDLQKGPDGILALTFDVKRKRSDILEILPTLLQTMAEEKVEMGPDWPVDCVLTGGLPVTKEFATGICSLGKRWINIYGGTEFGLASMVIVNDVDDFKEYSSGYPLPGAEIKIVDENEKTVPVGVTGEVYLRSVQMFHQYWNDPRKTESVLSADGWFKTDDMGHVSEDGALCVEGRKSDMIISGGANVSPAMFERVIMNCPGVAAVKVVPIPDPIRFQTVCACVIPVDGSNLTKQYLRGFCESIHNDHYTFLPHEYLLFEKFPQTSSGKVSRKKLAIIAEKMLKEL